METYQFPSLDDPFEEFLSAGVVDGAGREVGFIVGLRDNGYRFFAWVQNARREKGHFYPFGAQQRSIEFKSQYDGTHWAYRKARDHIARVQAVRRPLGQALAA